MNDSIDQSSSAISNTEVTDDERLYRRIHPIQQNEDGSVSSGAFTDSEMSVDRAKMRRPEESIANYPGMGLVAVVAGFARSLNQSVIAMPELLNMSHAEVRGHKTKATRKRFARSSEWVIRPSKSDGAAHPRDSDD